MDSFSISQNIAGSAWMSGIDPLVNYSGGILTVRYANQTTAGNVGICFVTTNDGILGTVQDNSVLGGNLWELLCFSPSSTGTCGLYINMNLPGGLYDGVPLEVSTSLLTGFSGSPSMILAEIGYPTMGFGISTFQCPFNECVSQFEQVSQFVFPGHTLNTTGSSTSGLLNVLAMGCVYDAGGSTGGDHNWVVPGAQPNQVIVNEIHETGGVSPCNNCGVMMIGFQSAQEILAATSTPGASIVDGLMCAVVFTALNP